MRNTDIGLLYFTAPWCVPCKTNKPMFKRVAEELDLLVIERNIDEEPEKADFWKVMSVPTVIAYRMNDDTQTIDEIDRIVGAFPEPILRKRLEALLG